MPKISIITPVYNVENYISKCIESILKQTFTDFELILINDGSTDKSLEICKKWSNKDIRIKLHDLPNGGVSAARNFGLDNAISDWICFIDSDDYIEKDYLNNFFKAELTYETIVYQGINLNFNDEYKIAFSKYANAHLNINDNTDIIKQKILYDGCPYGKLYNKHIINRYNLRFNTNLSMHEDHVFVWTYLQHMKKIVLIEDMSYNYMRRGATTLSTKRHPSEEYILASSLFTENLTALSSIIGIPKVEFNKIWSKFGLYQIIEALKSITDENCTDILNYAKYQKKNLIVSYRTSLKKKLGLILILNSPSIFAKFLIGKFKT